MDKIFLDTDIIIDLLAQRNPFYEDAVKVFTLAKNKKIKCFTSSNSIANIYYILSRFENKNFAKANIIKLRRIVSITDISENAVDMALNSDFKDFEDALQYYSAMENGLDFIITRNKKDYKQSKIPVFEAGEYLKCLENKFC